MNTGAKWLTLAVALFVLIGATGRGDDPAQRTARLTVQLVGFPVGTNFTVATEATYKLIDPAAPYRGHPPRGVKIPLSAAMVKRTMRAAAQPSWTATVTSAQNVEKTLTFAFPERLERAAAGQHAAVSVPVTFSWSDPATGRVRQPIVLGHVPLPVDGALSLARCFRITHQDRGIRYDVLKECSVE